jgi:SAM-dependent methyltransferase
VPRGWEWDETLFRGAAPYYTRGRLPYPRGLAESFRRAADLRGNPRLIDVGCGPGTVALTLAGLFVKVVGVDPDPDMLAEGARLATERGIDNISWVKSRAEDLPVRLGPFRYATFAQSFHWMERERVAAFIFEVLEPGGAFVHVNTVVADPPAPPPLPYPTPPDEEISALVESYLGDQRRAGQGVLQFGTASEEGSVLGAAGFAQVRTVVVAGREVTQRSVDDLVASVFSSSNSAPHLFGTQLDRFETELRDLLVRASDEGRFSQWVGDIQLDFYERP